MTTQKKESTAVKGQDKNSTAQHSPKDASALKGQGQDAQRKPEANAGDRDTKKERENDEKRPTMNSNKH
jgi:hypothetical protein